MMRIAKLMGTVGAVLALSACASAPTTPEPNRVQAIEAEKPLFAAPVPMENPAAAPEKPKKKESDYEILKRAMNNSKRGISECEFDGGQMKCMWINHHIYTMYLSSRENSTIYLNPDEEMNHHYFSEDGPFEGKPDWVGSPEGERDTLLVRGHIPGRQTKLIITTTRRKYEINLIIRGDRVYNSSLSFVYPEQVFSGIEAPPEKEVPVDSATNIPLGLLNTKYKASGQIGDLKGEQLQVMDDGKKTYVVFPEGVSARPPYFAVTNGHGDNVEMVTDPKGHYIIRGIYREAELQVGDQIIKIKRSR